MLSTEKGTAAAVTCLTIVVDFTGRRCVERRAVGAVEELELDSFGLSIMPSSLVSTYSLLVEDVLEVVSDAVVVRKAATSHIQRLSKVPSFQ
ncbi:hypothetical protein AHAS_Ahas19G0193800 [Arachis hypogaea]